MCKISGLTIVSLNLKKLSLQNLKGFILFGGGIESQLLADAAGIVAGNRLQMQESEFLCFCSDNYDRYAAIRSQSLQHSYPYSRSELVECRRMLQEMDGEARMAPPAYRLEFLCM